MPTLTPAHATHPTLAANTVQEIDLQTTYNRVLIIAWSASVWYRFDGVDPVAGADDNFVVPAGMGKLVPISNPSFPSPAKLRVIAASVTVCTVEGVVD